MYVYEFFPKYTWNIYVFDYIFSFLNSSYSELIVN